MDSKQQAIEQLVQTAERELAQNPKLYKQKLLRYSLFGYAVIFAILLMLVAIVSGIVWLAFSSSVLLLLLFKSKLIFLLPVLVWVLFKSVFIRWPKPQGMVITEAQAPLLYDMIAELRTELDTPQIDQIIIVPDFNASVVQTPRMLAFGFTHNTLSLGFEMLLCVTTNELKSIIAHELAHLSGNHSKFHSWIYQARDSWQNMMDNLDRHNSWATAPIRLFFNWYSPRFSAYSFALARLNEYEADEIAAQLTSKQSAVSALIKATVYADFIQNNHWQPFNDSVVDVPEPRVQPYSGLLQLIKSLRVSREQAQATLDFALKEPTNYHNTHPCLKDRLAALGCEQPDFVATEESAATEIFADTIVYIATELDSHWQQAALEDWKQEYRHCQQQKQELQALQQADIASLTQEQLWQLAFLNEKFFPDHHPLALYETYHRACPDDPYGQFAVGRLLLANKDDSGIEFVKRASTKDELLEACLTTIYSYLIEQGKIEQANEWLNKKHALESMYRRAHQERSSIEKDDIIERVSVPYDTLQYIVDQIETNKRVRRAWVAQKRVETFTDNIVVVFAIEQRTGFYLSNNLAQKIAASLEIKYDETVFTCTKSDNKKLYKKIIEVGHRVI